MSSTIETTDSTMSSSTTSTTSITTISSSISSSIATTATTTTSSTVYDRSYRGVGIVIGVGVVVFLCLIVLLINTLCKWWKKEKVSGQNGIADRTHQDVSKPYGGWQGNNEPDTDEIDFQDTYPKISLGAAINIGISTRDVIKDRNRPSFVNPDRLNHFDETDMNTEKQTTQF